MAFQSGSQINASLGAVNYTPYLQGAVQGAQSMARGIEQLGQAAGQAVQQYYEKKETKELVKGSIATLKGFVKNDSNLASILGIADVNDDKAYEAAIKGAGAGNARQGAAILQHVAGQYTSQQQQTKTATQATAAKQAVEGQIANYTVDLVNGAKDVPTPVSNYVRGMARLGAMEAGLKNKSEKPTPFGVAYQAFDLANPNATPADRLSFVNNYNEKSATKNTVNMGAGASKALYDTYQPQKAAIISAQEELGNIDDAIAEVESGKAFTGAGAEFKLLGAQTVQFLGSNKFDSEIAATSALSSSIATQMLSRGQRMKGSFSDKDIAFLQRAATGGSPYPIKETLVKLREIQAKGLERSKKLYNIEIEGVFSAQTDPDSKAFLRALRFRDNAAAQPAPGGVQLSPNALKFIQ